MKFNLKTGDAILAILFLTSLCLAIWGINIYHSTIIDIKYLFATCAFGIIITFAPLTFLLKSSYSAFWRFFIKAVIGAGLFYFGLLFLNQQFAGKELLTEDFKIIETGTLGSRIGGRFQPFAIIDFYGTEKELLFYRDDAQTVKHSTEITLTYSKGAFGFTVIKSRLLNRGKDRLHS